MASINADEIYGKLIQVQNQVIANMERMLDLQKKYNSEIAGASGVKNLTESTNNLNNTTSKLNNQSNQLVRNTKTLSRLQETKRKKTDLETEAGKKLLLEQIKLTEARKKAREEIKKSLGLRQRSNAFFKTQVKALLAAGAAYLGVTKAIQGLNKLVKNAISNADKQLKAEKSLLVALDGREDAQKKLIEQAKILQTQTLFGDEETIKAQALIAAFVKEEDQIKKVIPLVQDLATAKGMDLAGAADLVSKTLGSSTNALSRYGIQVKGEVGSTERLMSLTNGLSEAFGGQAKAAAKAGAGGLTQLKNVLGDLSENLGKKLLPTINRVSESLIKYLTPKEKTINLYNLENKELNLQFEALKNTNLSQDARKKLINDINNSYGKYLPNLLSEKSSLENIELAQKAVNDQLRINIISQAMKKEIIALLETEKNAVEGIVESQIELAKSQANRMNLTMEEQKQQEDFATATQSIHQATINNVETERSEIETKYKAIAEYYNIAFSAIIEAANNTHNTIIDNNTNESKVILDTKTKVLENDLKINDELIDDSFLTAEAQIAIEKAKNERLKEIRKEDLEDFIENQKKQMDFATSFAKDLGKILGENIEDGEEALKQAGKFIILFTLKTLKSILQQQVIASITSASIQSFAQPDSVATFGATGVIRAAILVGLIEAAYAGVEALIESKIPSYYEGSQGKKVSGLMELHGQEAFKTDQGTFFTQWPKYEGKIFNMPEGEIISNKDLINYDLNKIIKLGNVDFNGGITKNEFEKISKENSRQILNGIKNMPQPIYEGLTYKGVRDRTRWRMYKDKRYS